MISHRHVRNLIGLVLGALAGFSFTISVFPHVLGWRDGRQVHMVVHAVAGVWPWMTAAWAVGGLSVARVGAMVPGGVILAVVGAGSGLILAGVRIGLTPYPLLVGLLAGAAYGFVGGLILGRILAAPSGSKP